MLVFGSVLQGIDDDDDDEAGVCSKSNVFHHVSSQNIKKCKIMISFHMMMMMMLVYTEAVPVSMYPCIHTHTHTSDTIPAA